jgi:hypothetical protein
MLSLEINVVINMNNCVVTNILKITEAQMCLCK